MVEGEPFLYMATALVHRGWMKAHNLIIGYIPPSFSVAQQKLWVEAPADNGIEYEIVVSIRIERHRYLDKLSFVGIEPSPLGLSY